MPVAVTREIDVRSDVDWSITYPAIRSARSQFPSRTSTCSAGRRWTIRDRPSQTRRTCIHHSMSQSVEVSDIQSATITDRIRIGRDECIGPAPRRCHASKIDGSSRGSGEHNVRFRGARRRADGVLRRRRLFLRSPDRAGRPLTTNTRRATGMEGPERSRPADPTLGPLPMAPENEDLPSKSPAGSDPTETDRELRVIAPAV